MRHLFQPPTDHATVFPTSISRSVALTNAGLVLGDGSVLISMSKGEGAAPRLSLDADHRRFAALMSIVGDRPLAPDAFRHIEAADRFWQRGDKALANLRLIFADLPRLATVSDAYRLTLAAHLLDEGMAPDALTKELGLTLATEALKYAPDQARIPAGHGLHSGQFTFGREPAASTTARIVLAEEDDSLTENKDALSDQGSSVRLPHKGTHPPHPPILQPGPPPPVPEQLPRGIGVGPHATESIPAGPGSKARTDQRKDLNAIGICHECGTTDPGTESGNVVTDHQPPTALVPQGTPQRFFPHCVRCSRIQGGLIRQYLRRQKEKGEKSWTGSCPRAVR